MMTFREFRRWLRAMGCTKKQSGWFMRNLTVGCMTLHLPGKVDVRVRGLENGVRYGWY